MPDPRLTLLLVPQGGRSWIAGVIYLQNLIRAFRLLPEVEQPRVLLLSGLQNRVVEFADLGQDCPEFCHYAYRRADSPRMKIGGMRRAIALGRWPRSLESAIEMAKPDIAFPLHTVLGTGLPVASIGWIPDFQHKRWPDFFSEAETEFRDRMFRRLIDEAHHVIVSSKDAYRDLMEWFPAPPSRVSAFPFASVMPSASLKGDPVVVTRRYDLPDKFLMFPGQFWIHKNHRVLFEAIRILRDRGLENIALVCTGFSEDYRFPEYFQSLQTVIAETGIRPNLHILGLLPRHDQVQLMRRAVAIVQPSLFEGWSSLLEDCRTLGKRVFVTDIPVHREQAPSRATFFDPSNADMLAEAIAMEWKDAEPGPDEVGEREAYGNSLEIGRDFGRRFIAIARKVTRPEADFSGNGTARPRSEPQQSKRCW